MQKMSHSKKGKKKRLHPKPLEAKAQVAKENPKPLKSKTLSNPPQTKQILSCHCRSLPMMASLVVDGVVKELHYKITTLPVTPSLLSQP
jgi:hypothetical protein